MFQRTGWATCCGKELQEGFTAERGGGRAHLPFRKAPVCFYFIEPAFPIAEFPSVLLSAKVSPNTRRTAPITSNTQFHMIAVFAAANVRTRTGEDSIIPNPGVQVVKYMAVEAKRRQCTPIR